MGEKLQYDKGVYIAGRLSANANNSTANAVNYLHNVHRMMKTAQEVKEAGFSIFVPAIDLLMGIKFGYETYDDYFNNNLVWVKKSDAVFLVPNWYGSPGTEREIEFAWANNIPVFDQLDEMWEYFQGIEGGKIVDFVRGDNEEPIDVIKYRKAEPEKYYKSLKK